MHCAGLLAPDWRAGLLPGHDVPTQPRPAPLDPLGGGAPPLLRARNGVVHPRSGRVVPLGLIPSHVPRPTRRLTEAAVQRGLLQAVVAVQGRLLRFANVAIRVDGGRVLDLVLAERNLHEAVTREPGPGQRDQAVPAAEHAGLHAHPLWGPGLVVEEDPADLPDSLPTRADQLSADELPRIELIHYCTPLDHVNRREVDLPGTGGPPGDRGLSGGLHVDDAFEGRT